MCLAIPSKIIKINKKESSALVDYGDGTKRRINISLVNANIGDYVLVHAGFALPCADRWLRRFCCRGSLSRVLRAASYRHNVSR